MEAASPGRSTRRRLAALEAARSALMTGLGPLEHSLLRRYGAVEHPAVFIVGPPRSGTTLLYEMLIQRHRFAYISNLAHRFYLTPVTASRLGRRAILSWSGTFESRFGHIDGWGAPSEGGWVWNRWFPEERRLGAETAERMPLATIRSTIFALSEVLGGAFLNKNVMHSVHIGLLDALFPSCVFLHVRRDATDNIRSILRARASGGGPTYPDGWWSVRPPGAEHYVSRDSVVQAAAQVRLTHEAIERDARAIGCDRLLDVSYESMCREPAAVLNSVAEFLSRCRVRAPIRQRMPPPFRRGGSEPFDPATERQIERSFAEVSVVAHTHAPSVEL